MSEFNKNFIKLLLEQRQINKAQANHGFSSVGQILSSKEYLNKKIKDFDLYAKDFSQTKKN